MLIFLYDFHREQSLLKSIIKKSSPKINVKNIKKSSLGFTNVENFTLFSKRPVSFTTTFKENLATIWILLEN